MNFSEAVNGGHGCSNVRKDSNSGFRGSSRHDLIDKKIVWGKIKT